MARRALALPERAFDNDCLNAAIEPWLAIAPDRALAWLNSLSSEKDRRKASSCVVLNLATSDPARAWSLYRRAKFGRYRLQCKSKNGRFKGRDSYDKPDTRAQSRI